MSDAEVRRQLRVLDGKLATQKRIQEELAAAIAEIRGVGTPKIQSRRASSLPPTAGQVFAWSEELGEYELVSASTPGAHAHSSHTGLTTDNHHARDHAHASHPGTPDSHHPQSHVVASHSDTTATGVQLDAVTDGGEVDLEHTHKLTTYITIGSESGDGISYTV